MILRLKLYAEKCSLSENKERKFEIMKKSIHLTDWEPENGRIRLFYEDGDSFCVNDADFNRAFACFLSAGKDEIKRDFT